MTTVTDSGTFSEYKKQQKSIGAVAWKRVAMANVRDFFETVRGSLDSGRVDLAQLGGGPTGTLNLDEPNGLQRYAEILRPQIQLALKQNRRERTLLVVLLIAFFVIAAALVIYDHLHGGNSTAKLLVVPGLGVAAVWPLQVLIALNRQRVALEVFPDMMPLLSRQQAAKLAQQFLSGGLTWNIGGTLPRSSR